MTFSLFFLSAFTVPSLSSLPGLPLVSILSKTLPGRYLVVLFVPSFLLFMRSSSSTPTLFFIMHPLILPPCPIISPFPTCCESPHHFPTFVSQLPGEAASLKARVRCCPMCAAEGADPRAGGGVQGARGGHGVRTQGSRDGHRRGMVGRHLVSGSRLRTHAHFLSAISVCLLDLTHFT